MRQIAGTDTAKLEPELDANELQLQSVQLSLMRLRSEGYRSTPPWRGLANDGSTSERTHLAQHCANECVR